MSDVCHWPELPLLRPIFMRSSSMVGVVGARQCGAEREVGVRILAGMLLAIAGAITSFITVLVALDGTGALGPDRLTADRLAAFAVSGQGITIIPEGALLRHQSATLGSSRGAGAVPGPVSATRRTGVIVPPIVRRVPAEAPLASFEIAEAEEKKRSATAVAAVPPPQPQLARRPAIDTATRSALGGPKPASVSRSAQGVSSPVQPAPTVPRREGQSPDPARVSP
jgi:hypothetical protein